MLEYLKKFNNLPKEIKDMVSSDNAMAAIKDIEGKYGISLATIVMRVMTKDLKVAGLEDVLTKELGTDREKAEKIVRELREGVFIFAKDYLELSPKPKPEKSTGSLNAHPGKLQSIPGKEVSPPTPKKATPEKQEQNIPKKESELNMRSSSFFISHDDEEEVRQVKQNIKDLKLSDEGNNSDDWAKRVIGGMSIRFSSNELRERFIKSISTYVKGIRNRVDAKQALIRAVENGGLGMTAEYAEKVLFYIDKSKRGNPSQVDPVVRVQPLVDSQIQRGMQTDSRVERRPKLVDTEAEHMNPDEVILPKKDMLKQALKPVDVGTREKLNAATSRDADYDFSKLKKLSGEKKPVVIEDQKEEKPVIIKKDNTSTTSTSSGQASSRQDGGRALQHGEQAGQEKKELFKRPKKQEIANGKTVKSRPVNVANGKKRMADIKHHEPRLAGPIDELAAMDLVNFRRMGDSNEVIIGKIIEKLDLLEKESYKKRLEGIRAWRQSPVNRLYLEMGNESISQGGSVLDVINNRKKENKDYLTIEEFEGIMELNRSIRF